MMQQIKIANPLLTAGLVCLISLLVPGSAEAGSEHVIFVSLEFVDDTDPTTPPCPDPKVVFAAAACDDDEMGDTLEIKMRAAGLDGVATPLCICGPTFCQCAYEIPTGCAQDEIEISGEAGNDCATDSVRVEPLSAGATLGDFEYAFD